MVAFDDVMLRDAFASSFQTYLQTPYVAKWRQDYLQHVESVQSASEHEWMQPAFQQRLWENPGVTTIGPGNSVTVRDAYGDVALAQMLWRARQRNDIVIAPADRGFELQTLFDDVLAWVYPRYTAKRPKARIVRLIAALFPEDMTCIVDAPRIWRLTRALGVRTTGDFVAQHAAIRDRIKAVLGSPSTLADTIEQSMFSWHLWEAYLDKPDEGAVAASQPQRTANDLPPLSLLPPNAQRRGLNCIKDNVRVLVGMVREAEQGITRDDLVSVILSEADFLKVSSTPNMISQAQGGLGLIRFANGAYVPTDRGLEFLTAEEPAHVLRAPLVGRVFGMGQLLRILAATPGLSYTEASERLRVLVPTWTTKMAASQLVQWSKLVGFVRADVVAGVSHLHLTEDGEDYVAALPDDFDTRWTIEAPTPEVDDSLDDDAASDAARSGAPIRAYGVDDIVADGCFMPVDELNAAVALLRRKKNLVLQGPPGTGKTWLAKRLGYALLGAEDRSRVTAVQFQPSLSYEDFVRGWRPDGKAGLRLADGVFLQAVEAALAMPEHDHVLVIEEINRGNPSQIFGELLTLLESDKRNSSEALRLAYARDENERVYIPPNLHVIGTMNLADRSLALVDLALRRRFAFVTLRPQLGSTWRDYCLAAGAPGALITSIADRLGELNAAIACDRSLGEQFCVGHSFVTPPDTLRDQPMEAWLAWYHSVVTTEIAPLLDEYWFDAPATAAQHRTELMLAS